MIRIGSIRLALTGRGSRGEPQRLRMFLSVHEGRKGAARAVCRSDKSRPVRSPKKSRTAPAPGAAAAVSAVMLKDVHFDFDRYLIRPQDAEILKQDFSWLKANPGRRVRVEGNCDERGTVEYNLALGQKRADATKNYLVTLGADAKLLDTVSYGKERPSTRATTKRRGRRTEGPIWSRSSNQRDGARRKRRYSVRQFSDFAGLVLVQLGGGGREPSPRPGLREPDNEVVSFSTETLRITSVRAEIPGTRHVIILNLKFWY